MKYEMGRPEPGHPDWEKFPGIPRTVPLRAGSTGGVHTIPRQAGRDSPDSS